MKGGSLNSIGGSDYLSHFAISVFCFLVFDVVAFSNVYREGASHSNLTEADRDNGFGSQEVSSPSIKKGLSGDRPWC